MKWNKKLKNKITTIPVAQEINHSDGAIVVHFGVNIAIVRSKARTKINKSSHSHNDT